MSNYIKYPLFILCLAFFIAAVYVCWLKDIVVLLYEDKASAAWTTIVNTIYPRFAAEKHRFGLSFFLAKTDQLILRTVIVSTIISMIIYLYGKYKTIQTNINAWFDTATNDFNINIIRILLYSCLLWFCYDMLCGLNQLEGIASFYKPVLLFKLLHLKFPGQLLRIILFTVFTGSTLLTIVNIKAVHASIIAIISFILLKGVFLSFEKMDHGFATYIYALMIFPFALYEQRQSKRENKNEIPAWPVKLMMLIIALCYLMSGMEKILISGTWWLNADNFRTFLYMHNTTTGLAIVKNNILCHLLPLGALLFQLFFFLLLFFKKLKPYILITGIFFHVGTYLLFDIGAIISPWIVVYMIYIDWSKAKEYLTLRRKS